MEIQKAQPLYQQVYRLLRRKILSGELGPGESLLENRIAQALSISRTPVREALRQLEREGLVVGRAGDRVVVSPTEEEFVNLYTCRGALERIVAERAARFATEDEIQTMAKAIEEALIKIEAEDHEGVLEANTRFHDQMVESARMPQLKMLMETIRAQILVARRHVLSDSTAAERAICEEHAALLKAIRDRDAERARILMEAHMEADVVRGLNRSAD
ncbi:GntR family transcriptional regulator [Rubrobacter taiwanensis]|jgi:DNA-binding GntR family transcriptional regulator|uniref:GntR family transcriptional regulator n=1 Tax=Rubrobacter taiwanensis TaxID=185139 RepID=A0A4V2NX45_9ACTN|nr:GntR family transcriptional regulator [Rubrobacter taiwanensis]TCJ19862.1 GntR family transcriptional regulator [Rubrobacter taiwanensis]